MEFLKRYGLWIVLAVVMIVLLCVQFFWVSGLRAEEQEANEQVARSFRNLKSKASSASSLPSAGDLQKAKSHLESITTMGGDVERRWRKVTGGLNEYMSNGEREAGTILHPIKNEPIVPDVFAEDIRNLYSATFEKMRGELEKKMLPHLEQMLTDSIYGSEKISMESAELRAKNEAAFRVKYLTRILDEGKLIPVALGTNFSPPVPPSNMWQEWRAYLIARDVFERVVPACEVELDREVSTKMPVDPEKRKGTDSGGGMMVVTGVSEMQTEPDETVVLKKKGWRYIENISAFVVAPVVPGNAELPGEEKDAPATPEGTAAPAKPAVPGLPALPPLPGTGPAAGTQVRYHDVYTVTIEFTAHAKVVEQFMKEILRAKNIFYVPVSTEIATFGVGETEGDYATVQEKQWKTLHDVGDVSGMTADVVKVGGFEHEPPVKAKLVYDVYRFRYTDTDNPSASAAASATAAGKNTTPY